MTLHPEIPAAGAPARDVYSVSRLNREVRTLLERGLGTVWVAGELSNLSQPASGHWYFSVKDRNAQLRCAMYRSKNVFVGFTPRAGMQVLLRGRISLYEAKGECQLAVEHLEEAGIGALRREFERLKAKLAGEGLFALERKRPLPRFPRRIGVVTSPTGAAIRDILNVISRRTRTVHVLFSPAKVQGDSAGPDIAVNCISIGSVELTTTERLVNDCGQIGVTVSTLHSGLMIGPPAASEYAVEPVGVAMIRPSHR